jgi:hypothetical protein
MIAVTGRKLLQRSIENFPFFSQFQFPSASPDALGPPFVHITDNHCLLDPSKAPPISRHSMPDRAIGGDWAWHRPVLDPLRTQQSL